VCVERFDHHCAWLNNCVGVNNHNNYLFFVIYAWFMALLVMCVAMDGKWILFNLS
jgi:palmitoyltransferase